MSRCQFGKISTEKKPSRKSGDLPNRWGSFVGRCIEGVLKKTWCIVGVYLIGELATLVASVGFKNFSYSFNSYSFNLGNNCKAFMFVLASLGKV